MTHRGQNGQASALRIVNDQEEVPEKKVPLCIYVGPHMYVSERGGVVISRDDTPLEEKEHGQVHPPWTSKEFCKDL